MHLAAVIITLQVLGQTSFGFDLSIAQILASLLSCAVLEIAIVFRRHHVLAWPASAFLTGNGVAFVLRVPGTQHGDWWSLHGAWIFAATAIVSLASKYLIRVDGRHLFTPSNFGLVLCFVLLGSGRVEPLDLWWGPMSPSLAFALAVIVVGGLAILSRLRLLAIAVAFWATFAACLAVVALAGHCITAPWHAGPICGREFWVLLVTSPEILVFSFFMITDPRTVPLGRRATRRLRHRGRGGRRAARRAAGHRVRSQGVDPRRARARRRGAAVAAAHDPRDRARAVGALAERARDRRLAAGGLTGGRRHPRPFQQRRAPRRRQHDRDEPTRPHPPRPAVEPDRTADRGAIAADTVADIEAQANALQRLDADAATRVSLGDWRAHLEAQIRDGATTGRIIVATYDVDEVVISVARRTTQRNAAILATLRGTEQDTTYIGVPPTFRGSAPPGPIAATFEVQQRGTRFLLATDEPPAGWKAP